MKKHWKDYMIIATTAAMVGFTFIALTGLPLDSTRTALYGVGAALIGTGAVVYFGGLLAIFILGDRLENPEEGADNIPVIICCALAVMCLLLLYFFRL